MAAGPVAALSGSSACRARGRERAEMGQDLRAMGVRRSFSDQDTLAHFVDDSKFSNNPARRTTIAARTARLLLEWLKPSSHASRSEPSAGLCKGD
jgi:hypothetical protein